MKIVRHVVFGALCSAAAAAFAQEARKDEPPKAEAKPVPPPQSFVSHHSGRFGTETVAYTATAGETYLLDEKGEPKASIFTFAYIKEGVRIPRPGP